MNNIIPFPSKYKNTDLNGIIDEFCLNAEAATMEPDMDYGIDKIQVHIQKLLWQRGWRDSRIFLVFLCAFSFVAAIYLFNTRWFVLLIGAGIGLAYAGMRVNIMIERINLEITASNAILIELLKTKIRTRIVPANKNCV
jgi:hypothetical protein